MEGNNETIFVTDSEWLKMLILFFVLSCRNGFTIAKAILKTFGAVINFLECNWVLRGYSSSDKYR